MASSTLSDPYIAAAFWTGLGALLLTLLLALQIVRLRMALRRRARREARTLAKWRPLLNAAAVGEPPKTLPPLRRGERLPLLKAWAHLQASMRGEAQHALNELARRLDLDAAAREKLARGNRAERLLASLVLGHLRDAQAWPQLLQQAKQRDDVAALNAMWALARIDPQAAAEYLLPLFLEQENLALARVAGVLQEAREPCAAVLGRLLPELDEARLTRGLRIAEALRLDLPAGILAGALRHASVPVLVAGLRSVFSPGAIGEVRALLRHEHWHVRVHAAKALGRIGDAGDAAHLAPLLQDPEWWVRYRTAQALLELPGLSRQDIEALRNSLSDRFAADMLTQVMAEKDMA